MSKREWKKRERELDIIDTKRNLRDMGYSEDFLDNATDREIIAEYEDTLAYAREIKETEASLNYWLNGMY